MPPIGDINNATRPLDHLARVSAPGASSDSRADRAPSLNAEDPSLLSFYEKINRFDVQSDRDPPQPVSPWKAPQSSQRFAQPVHPIRMLPISGSARLAESEDGTGGGFGVFGATSPAPRLAGLSLPRGLQRHWSGALSGALQGPFGPTYQANSPGSSKALSARSFLRDAATWTGQDEAPTGGSPTRPGCTPTTSGPQASPSAGNVLSESGRLASYETSQPDDPFDQNARMDDAKPAHLPAVTASPPAEAGAARLAGIGCWSPIGGVAVQSGTQVAGDSTGSRQEYHSLSGAGCGAGGGSAPGGPSTSLQSEQPGQALPRELHQQLMALRAEVQQRALAQYDANRRHTMSLRQSLQLLCNAASTAGPRAPHPAPSCPSTAVPTPPPLTSPSQLSALAAERDALAATCSRLQRQCSSLIAYVGLLGGDPWFSAREACTWVRVGLGPGLSRAPGVDDQPPGRGAGAREGEEGDSEHGARGRALEGTGEGVKSWRWAGEEVSGLQGRPVPCGSDGETCCRSLGTAAGVASGTGAGKRGGGGGVAATRLRVRLRVASAAAAEGHGGLGKGESAVRVELSYVQEGQPEDGGADNTTSRSSSGTSADGAVPAAFPLAAPLALGVKHHGVPLPTITQPPIWRQQQQQQPVFGQGRSAALEAAVRRLVAVLEHEAEELAPPAGEAAVRDQPTVRPEAPGSASSAGGDATSDLLDKRAMGVLQQVLRDRRLAVSTSDGGHRAAATVQQQQEQNGPAGLLRPPAAAQLATCFTTQASPQPNAGEESLPAGEDEARLPRPLHAKRARLEQEGTAAPCTTPRIPTPPCSPRTQSPSRHLPYTNLFSSDHDTDDRYGGSQGSSRPHHAVQYAGGAGEPGGGFSGGGQQLLEATASCPVDLHSFDPAFRAWQTEGGVRRGGGGWSDDSDGWPEGEEDGDGEEEEEELELRELAAAAGGSPAALRAAVSFLREQLQLAQYEIVSLTTQLGSLSAQREGLRQRATQSDAALQQLAINEGEAMLELQQTRAQLAAERAARARLSTQCDELQRSLLNSLRDSLMLLPHHTTSSIVPLRSSSPGPALALQPHPHAQSSSSLPTTARGHPSTNQPPHHHNNTHRLIHKPQGQNHHTSRLLRYGSVGHQRPGSHGHGGSAGQGQGGREGAAGSPPACGVWGRAEPLVALWAKARAGRAGAAGPENAEEGAHAGKGLAG